MVLQINPLFLMRFLPLLIATVLSLAGCGGSDSADRQTGKTGGQEAGSASLATTDSASKDASKTARLAIIPPSAQPRGGAVGQGVRDQSGGSANSQQENPAALPIAGDYNYVIVSASVLPAGARVSVIRAEVSQTCVQPGAVSAFSPVASAMVITPGSVSLRFSDPREHSFIEIIYIDSNDSGHLDAGDRIWGSNPQDPAGVCFAPDLASSNRVNWDGVAAVIGGVSIYTGDGLDFLASAAGESQVPAGSFIIGETGYGNL